MRDMTGQEFWDAVKKSGMNKQMARKYLVDLTKNYDFGGSALRKWDEESDKRQDYWSFKGKGSGGEVGVMLSHDGGTVEGTIHYDVVVPSDRFRGEVDEVEDQVSYKLGPEEWRKNPQSALKKTLRGLEDKFLDEMDELFMEDVVRTKMGEIVEELKKFLD